MARTFSPMVVRPLDEFFSGFKVPKLESVLRRHESNIDYFKANYLILIALMSLILVFSHPIFLLGIASVLGTIWFFSLKHHGPVVIGSIKISRRICSFIIFGASYCILSLTGGQKFHLLSSLSFLLPSAHAILHKELIVAKFRRLTNKFAAPSQFEQAFNQFVMDLSFSPDPPPPKPERECKYIKKAAKAFLTW